VETWRERLAALPGKRIAFAWVGHAHHANDRNRSISLTRLAPLLSVEGASFISIQRDLREGDAEAVARYPNVMHAGSALNDMADTAALLSCVDLTIGVDTSVVHLAGALGREAYVMLPFAADWRWGVIGERSAWYPQLRLFRQDGPGDWDSVVARIRGALADFVRS
jgi:ADP-heptose:LPS heptosyltransferase